MPQNKKRLDTVLVERGLFDSRSRAAAAVLAGDVMIGPERRRAAKPGTAVPSDLPIAVRARPEFASRGALKLERAIEAFDIAVAGRHCLDAGASTGGFTDSLLRRGAAHVVAVDVAYGELHWKLRQDARVTVIERQNVRALEPDQLPYRPDLIVADLSFIGLGKALPALAAAAAGSFDLLALVKPQFELGRGRVGKGGVVRSPADRLEALLGAGAAAREAGLSVQGYCYSGLPGPAGNRESFIWCAQGSRPGVVDLRAAALTAEPQPESVPAAS